MVKNGWKYIDFYFLCGWCASDLHQKIVCMAQPNPNGCSQVSNTQIQRCKYKNTQMQDIASLKCLQNIYNTVYELNWHIFPNYWQVRGAPSHQICSFFEHCSKSLSHCSENKFNPNVLQLTSSLQIIISYIYTCHLKKSKYFTEGFTRYWPCTLGACMHT